MNSGVNCNVKTPIDESQHIDSTCEGLMCFDPWVEYVEIKMNEHKVIKIWACEKCAEILR